jgi:branched-chain amino acid transport system ATP-binding protein
VRENLMVGAYLRNDRAAIAHDLERVLGYFPVLAERLESPARDLSGGQQQMLAVGRALMSAPRLLMLDEPSIGLAPVVVEKIAEIITTISHSGVDVLWSNRMPTWRSSLPRMPMSSNWAASGFRAPARN